jgi:5-methylcytosine-specific restriction endonuclease McrA
MRSKSIVCALAAVLLACCVSAQQAQYQKHGSVLLPDPNVTKGDVALRDKQTVCTTKWGQDARHVTPKMKKDVYTQYGTAPGKGVCEFKTRTTKSGTQVTEGCEVDHLISRELGGADTEENLWPQPYTQHPGAHEKDWLENELHKEVCANTITLADAQKEITDDWYAAYLKRKQP